MIEEDEELTFTVARTRLRVGKDYINCIGKCRALGIMYDYTRLGSAELPTKPKGDPCLKRFNIATTTFAILIWKWKFFVKINWVESDPAMTKTEEILLTEEDYSANQDS